MGWWLSEVRLQTGPRQAPEDGCGLLRDDKRRQQLHYKDESCDTANMKMAKPMSTSDEDTFNSVRLCLKFNTCNFLAVENFPPRPGLEILIDPN